VSTTRGSTGRRGSASAAPLAAALGLAFGALAACGGGPDSSEVVDPAPGTPAVASGRVEAFELFEALAATLEPPVDAAPVLLPVNEQRASLVPAELELLGRLARGSSSELHRRLGAVYTQAEEYGRGAQHLVEALRRDVGDADAWYWLGVNRLLVERPDEALALLDRAAELGRDDADLHRFRGEAERVRGDWAAARAHFDAALAREPRHALALTGLTQCLEQLGDLDAARGALELLVELQPGHPTPLFRMARVLRRLGLDEAAREYEALHRRAAILDDLKLRGEEVSPARAHLAVATRLAAQGRAEEALAEFAACLALEPADELRDAAERGRVACLAELERARETGALSFAASAESRAAGDR